MRGSTSARKVVTVECVACVRCVGSFLAVYICIYFSYISSIFFFIINKQSTSMKYYMNTQCSICCNIASYRWVSRNPNSKSLCQSSKTLPTLPIVFVVEGSRFFVLNTSCSISVLITRACALRLSHFITCHFTTCHFTTCHFTTCQ